MSRTLAPADVSHYYQRLAELSTLPFWQREEFTEPAGPERGHVWHWQDVYPSSPQARSSWWPAAPGRSPAAARPSRSCPATWRPSQLGPGIS